MYIRSAIFMFSVQNSQRFTAQFDTCTLIFIGTYNHALTQIDVHSHQANTCIYYAVNPYLDRIGQPQFIYTHIQYNYCSPVILNH